LAPEKSPDTAGGQNVVKDIFERKNPDEVSSKKISSLFGGSAPAKEKAFDKYLPIGLDIRPSGTAFARVGMSGGRVVFAGGSTETKGALRQLISENELKGDAVIGLSVKDIQFRVLTLPPMPPSELDGAVIWAAAEALGMDARRIQEFSIDYEVLSEGKVLVAAAYKETVIEKMKQAADAGLNVLAVEPSPLSLYAALCSMSSRTGDAPGLTLLLNIGYGSGDITIGLGRDVWAVQDVAVSEEMLRGALNDDGSVAPKPSVSSALESLIIDIEHSFKTVSNLFPGPDSPAPGRIAVSGPGASSRGIGPFLKRTFNIPVETFDPLGAGPKLASAVALAMRGVKDETV
jgi:Tfp pilus assembly PilM family ATPase